MIPKALCCISNSQNLWNITQLSPKGKVNSAGYVVVQFYPWFKFSFLLFLDMVMSDNEFETKEKKIETKVKIEP